MVNITNGVNTFTVTTGAFETIYKPQGYSVVDDVKKATKPAEEVKEPVAGVEPEETADDVQENSKPIAQWSKAEVKEFAEANGIDLTGTKNVNEAKERIKDFLNSADAE